MSHTLSFAHGSSSIRRTNVVLLAVAVWTAALVHIAFPTDAGFFALRLLLSAMTVWWVVSLVRSPVPILAMSPLLLLAVTALLGYSLLEAGYALSPETLSYQGVPDEQILSYVGSVGEALVLQFVACCLFLTALIVRFSPALRDAPNLRSPIKGWNAVAGVAILSIAAMLAIDVAIALLPALKGWRASGIGKQLGDSIEPLTALGFAVLAHLAATRSGRFSPLFFGLAIIYLAVKTITGLVQTPILIVTMAALYYLFQGRRGIRVTLVMAGCAGLVAVSLLFGIAHTRYGPSARFFDSAVETLKYVFWGKVLQRQGRSARCFNVIVTKQRSDAAELHPFYFAGAIIPRAVWPDKPELSLGHEYAVRYCGASTATKHYELVTLLAEPVLRGGWTGLAVAQLFTGAVLALVGLAMPRCRPVMLIAIVALLPWLAHFQQSFALYFANAVKMFLYMIPAICILEWWIRRNSPAQPDATL